MKSKRLFPHLLILMKDTDRLVYTWPPAVVGCRLNWFIIRIVDARF